MEISICPVCSGTDIVQDYLRSTLQTPMGSQLPKMGSHCGTCGTRFAFNKVPRPPDDTRQEGIE